MNLETTPAPIIMSKSSAALLRVMVRSLEPLRIISWIALKGVRQM